MNIFHQKERGDILVDNEKSDINLTNETPRSYQALNQSEGGIRAGQATWPQQRGEDPCGYLNGNLIDTSLNKSRNAITLINFICVCPLQFIKERVNL